MEAVSYLLISTGCLTLFYVIYLLIFKRETNFRNLRLYLLASIFLSLVLPFNNSVIKPEILNLNFLKGKNNPEIKTTEFNIANLTYFLNEKQNSRKEKKWVEKAKIVYLVISAFFLMRIVIQLVILAREYIKSEKRKIDNYRLIYTNSPMSTATFFNIIFLHKESRSEENIEHIIEHEKVHARQHHSVDRIIIELLSAFMWFNPIIWMMRNSIQLVHEYLADEGVLESGVEKHQYQTLLLNQIAEGKIIGLSSSFNKSLIKKRITMMTKTKTNSKSIIKVITLLPLSILLFAIIACVNGLFPQNTMARERVEIHNNKNIAPQTIAKQIEVLPGDNTSKEDTVETVKVIGYGKKDTTETVKVIGYGKADNKKITYILDGKPIESMDDLNLDSVAEINVNKEEKIIVIKSKSNAEDNSNVIFRNVDKRDDNDVLFVVDGKVLNKQDLSSLDPNTLLSVEVYKNNKEMIKKYSDNDKYTSLIVVTTKRGKP